MSDTAVKYDLYVPASPTVPRIYAELAQEIGLNESIILVQIAHWIKISTTEPHEGRYWAYKSIREMQDEAFPYWGVATIKRAIDKLAQMGLVVIGNFNKRRSDKTQWYALDRKCLDALKSVRVTEIEVKQSKAVPKRNRSFQNGTAVFQNGTTLPEETPEETHKEDSVAPKGAARAARQKTKADTVRSVPMSLDEQHPERSEAEREARRKKAIQDSIDQTNREIARQKNFAELEKAVKVLPGVSGKLATQYAHMINGTATKGVYSEYRIEGGVTAAEFNTFVRWYGLKYPTQGLPKEVEKLYGYVNEWIDAGKPIVMGANGYTAEAPMVKMSDLSVGGAP